MWSIGGPPPRSLTRPSSDRAADAPDFARAACIQLRANTSVRRRPPAGLVRSRAAKMEQFWTPDRVLKCYPAPSTPRRNHLFPSCGSGQLVASSRSVIRLGLPTRTTRVVSPRVSRWPVPSPDPDSDLGPSRLSANGSQTLGSGLPSRRLLKGGAAFWAECPERSVAGSAMRSCAPGPFLKRVAGASCAGAGHEPHRVCLTDRGSLRGDLRPSLGHCGGRRIPRPVRVLVKYGIRLPAGPWPRGQGSNGARCCAHLILVLILRLSTLQYPSP